MWAKTPQRRGCKTHPLYTVAYVPSPSLFSRLYVSTVPNPPANLQVLGERRALVGQERVNTHRTDPIADVRKLPVDALLMTGRRGPLSKPLSRPSIPKPGNHEITSHNQVTVDNWNARVERSELCPPVSKRIPEQHEERL